MANRRVAAFFDPFWRPATQRSWSSGKDRQRVAPADMPIHVSSKAFCGKDSVKNRQPEKSDDQGCCKITLATLPHDELSSLLPSVQTKELKPFGDSTELKPKKNKVEGHAQIGR